MQEKSKRFIIVLICVAVIIVLGYLGYKLHNRNLLYCMPVVAVISIILFQINRNYKEDR